MGQSFWQKLKRVKYSDIIHIFKFLFAIPFAVILRLKKNDIWLLCDSRYEAEDNAFWLFQYVRINEPTIDAVFALDRKSKDYEKVAVLGPVIPYGSFLHWIYYLAASKNISSQKMGKPNAAVCYVLEVYGVLKNKRAFLQHGIISADLPFLHYKNTKMKLFVTSTQAEWEFVNSTFGYPEGYVQKLGLCRFDGLHDFVIRKNQILIMPTWRMYIRNHLSAKDSTQKRKSFMQTNYFKEWDRLLSDERFLKFIDENNLNVVFYPHREMIDFINCFSFKSEHIQLASWKNSDIQTLLKESAFLITDYSSVAMDFAYMKKPLLYYQFDYKEFRENHHPEGYFSFEKDGFGPVCSNAVEAINALILSYSEQKQFMNHCEYVERQKKYFDLYDSENCKRNYLAILKM